ncbi:MAG: hypothetical protein WKF36_06530 [Candidatus Nitrosocosmicus sp.]
MNYSEEYENFINTSIDSCYFLLGRESFENYTKLINLLESISSSSKLEDHPNVSILIEKARFLLESLVSSHKIPTEVILLLKDCFDGLKSDIKNENHNLDLYLIERIENNIESSKRDEKDFAFSKRIKTLFICNDGFLKELVLKKTDESIVITHYPTFNESFRVLDEGNFDIVLCDITEFNSIIEDFLITYSKRHPFVAICKNNDPKLLANIARMDVMGMVPRTGTGIKFLSKYLHASYSEWNKQKQKNIVKPLLENPQIKIILHDMLLTDLPIKQNIRSYFTNEIKMNPVIKESYNIQINDIIKSNTKIIDALVKEKYLIREEGKTIITCPNCDGVDVDINYLCEHCGNNSFIKYNNILIHKICGYANFKNHFKVGNNFCCPKCKVIIDFPIECYAKTGYYCKNCLNFFYEPKINIQCNFCNFGPFEMIESKFKNLFSYRINPTYEKQFKKNFFILEKLNQYLIQNGFSMSYNEKLSQDSKTEIFVDLIGRKDNQTIIAVILSSRLEYNIELLHHIEIAKRDNSKVIPLIISLEEPIQVLFNLITKFGIYLIVSENDEEIQDKAKEYLITNSVTLNEPLNK